MNTETQIPPVSETERKDAAQDAMNGLNEKLWDRIHRELGHEPTLAEAEAYVIALPDSEILLYI